jgi:hypothetical protein
MGCSRIMSLLSLSWGEGKVVVVVPRKIHSFFVFGTGPVVMLGGGVSYNTTFPPPTQIEKHCTRVHVPLSLDVMGSHGMFSYNISLFEWGEERWCWFFAPLLTVLSLSPNKTPFLDFSTRHEIIQNERIHCLLR